MYNQIKNQQTAEHIECLENYFKSNSDLTGSEAASRYNTEMVDSPLFLELHLKKAANLLINLKQNKGIYRPRVMWQESYISKHPSCGDKVLVEAVHQALKIISVDSLEKPKPKIVGARRKQKLQDKVFEQVKT